MLDSFQSDINAVVIGASGGIGQAFVKQLSAIDRVKTIYAFSRSKVSYANDKIKAGHIDITDEQSIQQAAQSCDGDIHLIIIATGMLHDSQSLPEKSLRDLNFNAMQTCFAINTLGPAVVAKYFLPLIPREGKSVFAALSARVGSISDNGIGGWYSYRASKTALSMMLKNAAIETGRKYKDAVIIGLHPGTVDTSLSKPFQSHVAHDIFTPEQAADYLLTVVDQISAYDSGKCFDWKSEEVLP
jgi:NAD(P)-dependent dehydrogenase (short-subunit alcohol dehydrogenase family)